MSFYDKNVKDQSGVSYISVDENTIKHQIKVEFSDEGDSSTEPHQILIYGKVPDGEYYHFIGVQNVGEVKTHEGKIASFKFIPQTENETMPSGATYSIYWERIK